MSSMLPDEAIRRLEEDLYLARKTIIGLAPDQFHDLLRGFAYTIETQNDLYRWQSDLNAAVIAAAEPIEPVGRWDDPKVACPLCRSRGRGAFGMKGWALPAGLEMHLNGGGTTSRCPVIDAAWELMGSLHHEKIKAAGLAEAQQLALRKQTEPVVLIDPDGEPELLFEPDTYYRKYRTPEQLAAVEDRLREIGFEIERNGNVATYRYVYGDKWMVLADPRHHNRVEFNLFKRFGKRQWKRRLDWHRPYLNDRFNKWPEKFHEGLKTATEN
jgi:hypothetical protein